MIIGFGIAALAASAFLHIMWFGPLDPPPEEMSGMVAGTMFVSIPFVALLVGYFAFLPALVVLVIAEFYRRRGWLFYALGGAAASLFFIARMLPTLMAPESDGFGVFLIAAAIGAGMVGGIAYWLVAGRTAGRWLDSLQ